MRLGAAVRRAARRCRARGRRVGGARGVARGAPALRRRRRAARDRVVEALGVEEGEELRSLDEAELAGFVEFCSGSARPPRADAPRSTQALKITPPPPGADGDDPDGYFPVASTCFFSLALPKYTCAAACAAKLKYAIKHAHLMDADFLLRHADGWEAVRS